MSLSTIENGTNTGTSLLVQSVFADEFVARSEVLVALANLGNTTSPSANLAMTETTGVLPSVTYQWALGSGPGGGGATPEGYLTLDSYIGGVGFSQGLVKIAPNPRGEAGPPVVAANRAIFQLVATPQSGVAVVPLGGATVAVANTSITASSVIMLTGLGAIDATATSFTVVLNAGVGFSVTANANATAAKSVCYFIVKY